MDPSAFGDPYTHPSTMSMSGTSSGANMVWRHCQTIKPGVTCKVKLMKGNSIAEHPVSTPVHTCSAPCSTSATWQRGWYSHLYLCIDDDQRHHHVTSSRYVSLLQTLSLTNYHNGRCSTVTITSASVTVTMLITTTDDDANTCPQLHNRDHSNHHWQWHHPHQHPASSKFFFFSLYPWRWWPSTPSAPAYSQPHDNQLLPPSVLMPTHPPGPGMIFFVFVFAILTPSPAPSVMRTW